MNQSANSQIKLSIIIAAWNSITHLTKCLSSLIGQITVGEVEIIVVSNFETAAIKAESKYDFVKFFNLTSQTTVPKLRSYGISLAQGDFVAISEDFCFFDAQWYKEARRMFDLPYSALGGGVENTEEQNIFDWAVFLYDYGKYMSPNHAGFTDSLSGVNTIYQRKNLEALGGKIREEFFETFVNNELISQGERIYFNPAMIIYHNKNYEFKKTLFQFYHQARSFAARRAINSSLVKRFFLSVASLVLPFILIFRIIYRTLKKHKHLDKLLFALPYLAISMTTWSIGELSGYLLGEGNSDNEWR